MPRITVYLDCFVEMVLEFEQKMEKVVDIRILCFLIFTCNWLQIVQTEVYSRYRCYEYYVILWKS